MSSTFAHVDKNKSESDHYIDKRQKKKKERPAAERAKNLASY